METVYAQTIFTELSIQWVGSTIRVHSKSAGLCHIHHGAHERNSKMRRGGVTKSPWGVLSLRSFQCMFQISLPPRAPIVSQACIIRYEGIQAAQSPHWEARSFWALVSGRGDVLAPPTLGRSSRRGGGGEFLGVSKIWSCSLKQSPPMRNANCAQRRVLAHPSPLNPSSIPSPILTVPDSGSRWKYGGSGCLLKLIPSPNCCFIPRTGASHAWFFFFLGAAPCLSAASFQAPFCLQSSHRLPVGLHPAYHSESSENAETTTHRRLRGGARGTQKKKSPIGRALHSVGADDEHLVAVILDKEGRGIHEGRVRATASEAALH